MVETLLVFWMWLAFAVFVVGCGWRGLRWARAPVHLRWDLYPVAHEPRPHGGSYLEEKEWWTKPRHVSLAGEAIVMAEEILLLKGVWEHNRKVWWASFPFHWGLYLLIVTTGGLALAAVGLRAEAWLSLLAVVGGVGGGLLAAGSLALLWLRSTEPKLRPYTAPLDLANLAVLVILGGLSLTVAVQDMAGAAAAMEDLLRFRTPGPLTPVLAAHMAVAGLFLLYFPLTRMVHFFAKYFTYHAVRWDDRPRQVGTALDRSLAAALNFGVTWAAPHVRTGKTWAEVATTLPGDAKKGD